MSIFEITALSFATTFLISGNWVAASICYGAYAVSSAVRT
jgi:hypothetical protein